MFLQLALFFLVGIRGQIFFLISLCDYSRAGKNGDTCKRSQGRPAWPVGLFLFFFTFFRILRKGFEKRGIKNPEGTQNVRSISFAFFIVPSYISSSAFAAWYI